MLHHNSLRQHMAIITNVNVGCRILYFKLQKIRKILLSFRHTAVHQKKKKFWIDRNQSMYRITDMFKDNTEIILGEISTTKFAVYQKFCLNHTQSKKRMSSINNSLRQAIIPQKPGKCLNREEKASPRLCTPRAVSPSTTFPGTPEQHRATSPEWPCRIPHKDRVDYETWTPAVTISSLLLFSCAWPLKTTFYDTIFRSRASNNILTTAEVYHNFEFWMTYKLPSSLSLGRGQRCILSQQPSTTAPVSSPHQKAAIAVCRNLQRLSNWQQKTRKKFLTELFESKGWS